MVQAARSGVQNIAEGSMASGTSKKIELKLTGIARASLEELLSDPLRLKHTTPRIAANIMICLVNQAGYLIGKQIKRLEENIAKEGGFTERLYKYRKKQQKNKLGAPNVTLSD